MSKRYDVTAITGKYKDNAGNEKNRYMTIGAIIDARNGPMLKLEAVPMGWNGWAYLNEPRKQDERAATQSESAAPATDSTSGEADDIPF